ncbi:C-type mannose receptor 2-like isoform 2-T2 [Menidia menidia]
MLWSVGLLTLLGLSPCFACKFYQYKFVKEKKNWTEAKEYCRQHYTDLATVMNKEDVERLQKLNLTKEESWIGLYSNSTDKKWLWSLPGVEFDNSTNMWDDKEPNGGAIEVCGTLTKHKQWNDVGCCWKQPFICYDGNDRDEKFHLIDDEKQWFEAQRYCREKHTDLISGRDQLNELNISLPKEKYFIGLFKNTWRWSDGSHFSFRNWTDLGNNQGSSDQCVALTEESSMMSDECTEEKPFFCYVDKVVLIRKKMNWENALYYCREHHHDLVTIRNFDEQQWVQEKAKKATTPFVWMGLHHTCTLGFWFWVGGEFVSYNNWNQTAVRDECNMSAAMEANGQHKWLKKNDDEEFNFICSKY